MDYIMALDSGTTSCRTVIYDASAKPVSTAQHEFKQYYPYPSWVEHDAEEIWATQLKTMRETMAKAGLSAGDIKAIGITNQRETTVVWDRLTGKPITRAIVWQCRRTAGICEDLKKIKGFQTYVQKATGLVIDAYFSATKIKWIFDNVPEAAHLTAEGRLAFGTVDSWLIYKLTGGRAHVTDYSNASRTMLYNINRLCWDDFILDTLGIPAGILPEVVSSSGICAYSDPDVIGGSIPISGIAGDQQSSLFGQGCFSAGEAKNTYGTGCFLLMNTGSEPVRSQNGLVTTIAWGINGKVEYALEGSVFMGGATVQWLRDELKMIDCSAESEDCAMRVTDSNGVYIVPAFTGLGAPYWDMYAKGIICGLTRGASRDHIVRAALESIAYQVKDLLDAIEADSSIRLRELMVDGGACANNFLMQFQSDILRVNVNRPRNTESTSLGAAFLAGLGAGLFRDREQLKIMRETDKIFKPGMDEAGVRALTEGWEKSVRMCKAHG